MKLAFKLHNISFTLSQAKNKHKEQMYLRCSVKLYILKLTLPNGYRRRKWNRGSKFKYWTNLFIVHFFVEVFEKGKDWKLLVLDRNIG